MNRARGSRRWGDVATVAAVGFLLLDAYLLLYGAITFHRVWLGVGGALCFLLAVLVFVAWRRYRRTLADLDAGRAEMKAEAEEIRRLLREKNLHN